MDKISPTELRSNIYAIIDRVIATGEPCEIVRGKHCVVLMPESKVRSRPKAKKRKYSPEMEAFIKATRKMKTINDLSKIKPLKNALVEDAEFYRHIEWDAWKPNIDL